MHSAACSNEFSYLRQTQVKEKGAPAVVQTLVRCSAITSRSRSTATMIFGDVKE